MRQGTLIGAATALVLFSADGTRFSYLQESRYVCDAARVLPSTTFEPSHVRGVLKQFVRSECAGRKLARLTLAASDRDLRLVGNANLPSRLPNPAPDSARQESLAAAQVMCFGDLATAWVRQHGVVTRYQLLGVGDAREIVRRPVNMKLVGFRLRPGWKDGVGTPAPDRVWLYAQVDELPDLDTAARIYSAFESQLGVVVYLVIRTDSLFFHYDGPYFDAFTVPVPEISDQEYLARPLITCMSRPNAPSCQLRRPE